MSPLNPRRALCCAGVLLAASGLALADDSDVAEAARGPVPAMPASKAAQYTLLDIAVQGTRAIAAGQQGAILYSDDGQNWKQAEVPVSALLTRLRFTNAKTVWATGYDATLLHSTDGGERWTMAHFDASARALFDVLFVDEQRGIAVGAYGTYLETADGGKTWAPKETTLSQLGMHLNVILKLSDGALFVAGERGLMARSEDAGASWQVLDSPYGGSWFGAQALGDQGMLVFGMRGNVFTTNNLAGCRTMPAEQWDPYERPILTDPAQIAALGWRKHDNPSREGLFGILPLTPLSSVLVGVNGAVLKFEGASGTLSPVQTPAKETLTKLIAYKGHLLGVGRRGIQDLGELP